MKKFRFFSSNEIPAFQSKACAYNFWLAKLLKEGKDSIEAHKGAVEIATQQAEMLKLSDNIVVKKTGLEGGLQSIGMVFNFIESTTKQYPKATDFAVEVLKSAGAGTVGALFGAKASETSENSQTNEVLEPIVYADDATEIIAENEN